jgi:hypothetical protein
MWMKYPGGNAGQSGETVDYGYSSTGAVKSVTQPFGFAQGRLGRHALRPKYDLRRSRAHQV